MKASLIVIAVLVVAFIAWRFLAIPRPAQPPLELSDDDPDMKQAMKSAQDTLAEFRELHSKYPNDSLVKVPFLASSGKTEYLAADVLEIVGDDVKVRLSTPPVTHEGKVERLQTYPLSNIVDWVIVMPEDKRRGGFTMKVMLKKAKEQWGSLPAELAAEEMKYE